MTMRTKIFLPFETISEKRKKEKKEKRPFIHSHTGGCQGLNPKGGKIYSFPLFRERKIFSRSLTAFTPSGMGVSLAVFCLVSVTQSCFTIQLNLKQKNSMKTCVNSATYVPSGGEINTMPSLTIQGQGANLRELTKRYLAGANVDDFNRPVFFPDYEPSHDDTDFMEVSRMDIIDRHNLKKATSAKILTMSDVGANKAEVETIGTAEGQGEGVERSGTTQPKPEAETNVETR